jgi:hypothetical protein
MSKKVRAWIVISVVWLIVLLVVRINSIPMGMGIEAYHIQRILTDYLLFGVLPVVVGWGIWWIRKS